MESLRAEQEVLDSISRTEKKKRRRRRAEREAKGKPRDLNVFLLCFFRGGGGAHTPGGA